MMTIRLYNTMTGSKEVLETIEPNKIRFYACGPTVYNLFHVGNARMFVVFDTVRRYLEYRGYEVRFVQNFTDVDDRIINRANELSENVRDVANRYIDEYFNDAKALGIREATVHPRATECIPEIIEFIADLIRLGHAYEREGDVYFDTSSFAEYGKLSHQSLDEMQAGFRITVLEHKDDPTDFALWKSAKPGEEYWESPWGPGRPGWHIECSVMNAKYLGEEIDIHAGGRDLVFPHHENEIAQSESRFGHTFARYWLHNGTLNINGEKMSKSLGNFIMTRDLLERRRPAAVRFFLLSAQYRHPLNYTEDAMDQAEQSITRIERALRNIEHRREVLLQQPQYAQPEDVVRAEVQSKVDSVRQMFTDVMDDDFNTADGIAAIFEAVRLANTYLAEDEVRASELVAWELLIRELLLVLGLAVDVDIDSDTASSEDQEIESLVALRNEARKARNFARADEIRDELAQRGVVIEDTAQGTRWFRE
ncbi:cysteine--tRNA ligase [Alicyclobacillus mengziensis]|uniref:Cysteine--tRNA ligase n=1 Tax=Alicyclobacillus mengziensis TaxID=2931921 RepID=A0A9X7W3H3_9BACL|nr:cysteine--tRNA ligase [Alicyclobacillus mengziensis]QSO49649.1 cysteine--tRNA ligase [Alicyclobacillus mengziensis]